MSPELLAAVRERVERGYSDDQIRAELKTAGHSEEIITEVLSTARATGGDTLTQIPAVALPKVTELALEGWQYARYHPKLSLLLAIPMMALYGLETLEQMMSMAPASISVAALVVVLVNLFCTIAVLYVVVRGMIGTEPSLASGFSWAAKNVLALLWIGILSMCVVWGGLVLLVIPGLIISFYIYFAQYVYVSEGRRGLAALLRSRQLVRGDALAVVKKLLGLIALLIAVLIVLFASLALLVSVLSVLTGVSLGDSWVVDVVVGLVGQVGSAILTVIGFYITAKLYQILARKKPYDEQAELPGKQRYLALVIWGAIALVATALLVGFSAMQQGELDRAVPEARESDERIDFEAKERAVELRTNL